MSYLYKTMTHSPADAGWEDDSFASGWVASYCALSRDGDVAELTVNVGCSGGWIQKDGLSIDASTFKYCVVCVKGTDRFFVEVYDGSWKSVTSGHEVAPSQYDVKLYDLSSITTGTITSIRLGVGDAEAKTAYYDFIAFHEVQPAFATGKIINVVVRQRETDLDEFEIIGTSDVGGDLQIQRHLRIWMFGLDKAEKVFAGVIEERTPVDTNGRVVRVSGRCFGQKLLLRTKSKTFTTREVSLAVKDFAEDFSEVTTYQVETPSPTVNITKDYKYEYIMDGLKDLARQAGSDWEAKLGMGHDLRFRSRASSNVAEVPVQMTEGVHILRGVRKETDGFRHFNMVTVVGGELSNFDNNPDSYTDTGDAASWEAAGGGSVTEDKNSIAFGACSLKFSWDQYLGSLICRYDFSASGKDLTPFKYMKFHHRTDSTGIQKNPPEAIWEFYVKLKDTGGVGASKVYIGWGSIQPPQNFTEVVLKLSDFSEGSGFDWTSVRYIEITCYSDQTLPGDGVKGNYWIDKVHLYARNVTRSTSASTDFKHVREYVYRDEKLIDPDFISQVSNALLNVLKNNENRYRVPLIGMAFIKVGHKVEIVSPSHGLNGWYYIVEVEHRITPETGYITEMTLDKPRLCLETLLAEAIERKIKLIERGGIA